MTSYRMEFYEPTLPATANTVLSWHYRKQRRYSQQWNKIVQFWVASRGKPPAPLKKAKLTLVRHSSVEPDYDGLVGSCKVLIDALRYNGVLADDKMQNVGIPIYLWRKAPPKGGGITVIVESVE